MRCVFFNTSHSFFLFAKDCIYAFIVYICSIYSFELNNK